MRGVPRAVVTLWLPAIFLVGLCLSLNGLQPQFWAFGIPLVLLFAYMNTLAEIHKSGKKIRIQRWWGSIYIDESEILDVSPSVLQGIERLQGRRFLPPWGVIYFVTDWSTIEVPRTQAGLRTLNSLAASREHVRNLIGSALMAASGFIVGRVLSEDFPRILITGNSAVILAFAIWGAWLFCLRWKKMRALANVLLFLATLIGGFVLAAR